MDFGKLKGEWLSNGKVLKDNNGRPITLNKFISLCIDNDIPMKTYEAQEAYDLLVFQLGPKEIEDNETPLEKVKKKLNKQEVFKGFKARGDGKNSSLIYYNNKCLGASVDLNAKVLCNLFSGAADFHHILELWTNLLTPYSKLLKLPITTDKEVVEMIWENLFNGPREMEQEYVNFSQPPAILEGYGKGVEYTIPFTKQQVALSDLNPILADFLTRMEDHKHFCAIIVGRLMGFNWHYIPWIYGKGGEGKSTFTRFLNHIVPDGTAEVRMGDVNGLWEALGKTFLIFGDTGNKNLIFYEEIKKISGGDPIMISGKYKHSRTEVLPGLIIATSNRYPSVGASPAIRRRARVFTVRPGDFQGTEKEVTIEKASVSMANSVNAFLNYSLQCLEEVGNITTGQVPDHPSNVTGRNEKTLDEFEYEDFIDRVKLSLNNECSIPGQDLRNLIANQAKSRNEYFKENFLEYIQNHKDVSFDGKIYYGIGRLVDKNSTQTQFVGKKH